MKRILIIGAALSLTLSMAACSQEEKEPKDKNESKVETPAKEEPKAKSNEEVEKPVVDEMKEEPTKVLINTDKEKNLEVMVNGNTTTLKGTLHESINGYNMYVLDGYALEAEEPGKDVLLYSEDGSSFARIQKLEAEMNMEDIKESSMQTAAEMGEVFELDAKDSLYPYFYDAEFYVMASSEEEGTMSSLVKLVNGVPFKYSVHLPKNETTDDISSALWAMLSTVAPLENN